MQSKRMLAVLVILLVAMLGCQTKTETNNGKDTTKRSAYSQTLGGGAKIDPVPPGCPAQSAQLTMDAVVAGNAVTLNFTTQCTDPEMCDRPNCFPELAQVGIAKDRSRFAANTNDGNAGAVGHIVLASAHMAQPGDTTTGRGGKYIHVIVDNIGTLRFDIASTTLTIPNIPGPHIIRAFLESEWSECVKLQSAFDMKAIGVGTPPPTPPSLPTTPTIEFCSPVQNTLYTGGTAPLDFFVSGATLGPVYRVAVTLSGPSSLTDTLSEWRPYCISGLIKGAYTITLQLVQGSTPVPGTLATATEQFQVN